jgi:hypothetical protein
LVQVMPVNTRNAIYFLGAENIGAGKCSNEPVSFRLLI